MTAYSEWKYFVPITYCNKLVHEFKDSVRAGETQDKGGRSSKVCFLDDHSTSDYILSSCRNFARNLGLNAGVSLNDAEIQFSRYDVGDFYEPHVDYRFDWGDKAIRKYTVVVNLSPPDAYEGGLLVFPTTEEVAPKTQGSAFVFPGFVSHGVSPVLDGTRYSLALWFWGDQWR